MVGEINWKELARVTVEQFNEEGQSVCLLHTTLGKLAPCARIVDTTPKGKYLVVEGEALSRKALRTYWWELRKERALQRENALLWVMKESGTNRVVAGVGAAVSNVHVLGRLEKKGVLVTKEIE